MDSGLRPSRETANIVRRGLKKRYAAEQRFKLYGLLAVCAALAFLVIMLGNIIYKGHTAFIQTEVKLEIYFDEDVIDPTGKRDEQTLRGADYGRLIKTSLRKQFPNVQKRRDKRKLYRIVSAG